MLNKLLLSVSLLLVINFCEANSKKKIYIADRKVFCKDILAGCLQVKDNAKNPWGNFSGILSGFDYQEGYEYRLLIEIQGKDKFSASKGNYKVLKVLSKKKTDYNPASRLEGKTWVLHGMDDTHNILSFKDSSSFIKFDLKNNKLSGHATCNGFSAAITKVDGSNLTLGTVAATKMLCSTDNKMAFEKIIFAFLQQAATYRIEGNILTIVTSAGESLVFDGE